MSLFKKIFANETIKRWFFNRMSYNQYGMLYNDILYETPEVTEAVRRLPQKLKDERNYRILRAHQLALTHSVLPKEEWTKFEEDVRYLEPFLQEVENEIAEKKLWVKSH